jgi:sugar lactone lactonase YvrE
MFPVWMRSLARRFASPAIRTHARMRRARPALENLEDRVTPATVPLAVTSYFDSAIYEFNATNGALINTLIAPYSQTTLSGPAGIAVGPDGNLYISSQNNNSIVEFNVATQSLSTFIDSSVLAPIATANGDTNFAPAGLSFGPDGNLYVSLNGGQTATSGGAVVRFDIAATSGQLSYNGTNATIATGLVQPTEMTFGVNASGMDSLFVSNSAAGNVIKITHATAAHPTSSTFIPAGRGGLNYPSGLMAGGTGGLYVVDLGATSPFAGKVLHYGADGSFIGVFTQSHLQAQFPSDAVFTSSGQLITADLGPNYPPNLQGSLNLYASTGTFMKTLVSSSAFPNTGPGTSGFAPSQLTLNLGNQAPTISAGGNYTLNEGSSLTLHAVGADPQGFPLTYSWDVNGDGTFGDATGANPTLSWAQLVALGVGHNGTFNVSVIASDGHGQAVTSAPVTLTVNYVPPTVPTVVTTSYFDSAVYEFNASSGRLLNTLVAPYSQSTLSGPSGLTVGPDGNLYISSQNNGSIVVDNVATNTLSTFIDSASVGGTPNGLRFGPDGNLYVALGGGSVVRYNIAMTNGMLTYTGVSSTIASGLADPTELTFGVAASDIDSLFVSNSGAGDVLKIAHAIAATVNPPTTFIAASADLNFPSGITWGPDGKFYVVDLGATTHQGQILRYNASGQFLNVFAHPSSALNAAFPSDAVFNGAGSLLTANLGPYYPPNLGGSIAMFSAGGAFQRIFASSSEFAMTGPGTSGFSPSQLTLNAGNHAPRVNAGTAYTINEGHGVTLNARAADPEGSGLTYSWDVNGDGTFGDATGASPTLSWARLQALGITHDGTWNVQVIISDGHGQVVMSAPVALTVKYVPPTVKVTGKTTFTIGQPYTLNLSSVQIGTGHPVDHWTINWGDGSAPQQVIGSPSSVIHAYTTHGHFAITASVTNDVGTFDASNSVHVSG